MTITVYQMDGSGPCRAVLMTAEHLKIDVKKVDVDLMKGEQLEPDFVKINPRSCVPTIDDDGFYLWESRAIMTYLVNKYAPSHAIYPKDPKKRAVVDMMLSFDQGSLYRAQVEYLYPMVFRGEPPDETKEPGYLRSLTCLEHSLQKNAYVAGKQLTLADFSIVANISLAEVYNYNLKQFPNIVEWLRRLKSELPYFKEVNEIPLYQFKFWYRPYQDYDQDIEEESAVVTKM